MIFSAGSRSITAAFLAFLLATSSGSASFAATQAERETAGRLLSAFAADSIWSGNFLQFNPDGGRSEGRFWISRPGKARFSYDGPAALDVIANDGTIAIHNPRLDTWDFIPLNRTPLEPLLSLNPEIDSEALHSVREEGDSTIVALGEGTFFGGARIDMTFERATGELRQWSVTDPAGKETSVAIFNLRKNIELPEGLFHFDEAEIRRRQREKEADLR